MSSEIHQRLSADIQEREARLALLLAATPAVTVLFVDARRRQQVAEYRVWRTSDLTDQERENLIEVGAVSFSARDWRAEDFEEDFEPESRAARLAGCAGEAFVLLRRGAALASWAIVSPPTW